MTRGFTTNDPTELKELLAGAASSRDMQAQALEDLRRQLAEARDLAERGWARVALLEKRAEVARLALNGLGAEP